MNRGLLHLLLDVPGRWLAATATQMEQAQGPAKSWADTLAVVYRFGLMVERAGTVAEDYAVHLGIDNLIIQR